MEQAKSLIKIQTFIPAILAVVLGALVTLTIEQSIRSAALSTWEERASVESQNITNIFLDWVDREVEPIRTIAALFYASQTVTPQEFLESIDFLEYTENTVKQYSVALVEESEDAKRYVVKMSSGKSEILSLGSDLLQNPAAAAAINRALNQPDMIAIGPFYRDQLSEDVQSILAVVVPNEPRGGLIVSILNLSEMLRGLEKLHIPPGVSLSIYNYEDELLKEEGISIGEYETPIKSRVLIRGISGSARWNFQWSFHKNYSGGGDYRLATLVRYAGLLLSAVIGLVVWFYVNQNNRITKKVKERTKKLEDAMVQLQLAKDQLVYSEKMASLGGIVAGVAHEMNTPIGNTLMAASSLLEKTEDFSRSLQGGQIKKSALNDYIDSTHRAASLILENIKRTTDLVGNFKQVAVDQTSERRREFDLKKVVDEVAWTLTPKYKRTSHSLEVNIDSGIILDSYPGPLGQVVTNLVANSLSHGFENMENGKMRFHATLSGGLVELVYSDNGKGIESEDLKRIFEPFYTTKLGKGGSGLGLNIVYNVVVSVLGGEISVFSQKGDGVEFTMKLPLVAPDKSEKEQELQQANTLIEHKE